MDINDIKNGYIDEEETEIVKLDNIQPPSQPQYKKVSTEEMVASGSFKEDGPDESQQVILERLNTITDINGPISESIKRRTEEINNHFEEEHLKQELGNVESIEENYNENNIHEVDSEFDPSYEGEEQYVENIQTHKSIKALNDNPVHIVDIKPDNTKFTEVSNIKNISSKPTFADYDKELESLDSEIVTNTTDDSLIKLKKLMIDRLGPIEEKLDITGFVVANRPISLNNSLTKIAPGIVKEWALLNTGIPISVSQLGGDEIEEMARNSEGRNILNTQKSVFKKIYDHIVSPKPDTLEGWLKVISFYDIKHLYMAIYNATFSELNFIPYNCVDESCGNVFLTENMSIESMCKFNNDESKAKFNEIFNAESTSDGSSLYISAIEPISSSIAFAIREPSIYNRIFETNITDRSFAEKYSSIIAIMPWISNIYCIDRESRSLRPIAYKNFPDSVEKTAKSKIITYAQVIRQSLDSDQYTKLISLISKYDENKENGLSYVLPGTVCPVCGKAIEETEYDSHELLFTRHRLGALRNI